MYVCACAELFGAKRAGVDEMHSAYLVGTGSTVSRNPPASIPNRDVRFCALILACGIYGMCVPEKQPQITTHSPYILYASVTYNISASARRPEASMAIYAAVSEI